MFKNISSRIIIAFSFIVLAGILLFAVITFGIFYKFSSDMNGATMKLSAHSVSETVIGYTFLAQDAHQETECTPEKVITELYPVQFAQSMEKYSEDGIGVHIYDKNGDFLIATPHCKVTEPIAIELKKLADERLAQGDTNGFYAKSQFHSEDESRDTIFTLPIVDENSNSCVGYIVVSSSSNSASKAQSQLISAIITTCIWLLLGTAFAIIIVAKRISKPFSVMSETIEKYSNGDTSARIRVTTADEVGQLATAINEMMDTIERDDKNKDTFLASVAHDLRTPMTTISGFADGIIDGTIPPEKQQQYLATISEETKRLSRLISTLLTTTKMQNQKINPKPFNITDKAISTLFTFEGQIDDKCLNVEITNDEPIWVNADQDAIHQIFYNLIHNAVKFSPTGGSLVIDISKDESISKAVISIRNDGEGIPEEEVPHVFEKFYKSDRSRGLDKSGMGLGLFIVKTVIDSHKEKITVKSGKGKGCEFTFTLPLSNQTNGNK